MRLRILSHSDVLPVKKSEVNKLVMDRAVELFQFAARFFSPNIFLFSRESGTIDTYDLLEGKRGKGYDDRRKSIK